MPHAEEALQDESVETWRIFWSHNMDLVKEGIPADEIVLGRYGSENEKDASAQRPPLCYLL